MERALVIQTLIGIIMTALDQMIVINVALAEVHAVAVHAVQAVVVDHRHKIKKHQPV